MASVTGVGVFEDLMKDPHLKDLVGQSATMQTQLQHQAQAAAAARAVNTMKPRDTNKKNKNNNRTTTTTAAATAATNVQAASVSLNLSGVASLGGGGGGGVDIMNGMNGVNGVKDGMKDPLVAAREAVSAIHTHVTTLKASVSHLENKESIATRKINEHRQELGALREETEKGRRVVNELERALERAKEELASIKAKEEQCLRMIDFSERELKDAQRDRARSLSQFSAATNAQKHLEESFQYLATLDKTSCDSHPQQPASSSSHNIVHNPLNSSNSDSSSWPWESRATTATAAAASASSTTAGNKGREGTDASLDPMCMPNPYTVEGDASRLSVEEKAKQEEEEARMAAVERSKREKEAILKARKARKAAAAKQPANVVLKTSELLKKDVPNHNQEKTAQQQQQKPPPQKVEKEIRIPAARSTPPPVAKGESSSNITRSVSISRDEVRTELEEKLYAFMPSEHEFREASKGSVPERSRASPGGLCNRHCSRDCLKSCTAGFLLAMDIPVKSSSGKVGLDELFQTVNKAMRKFHPDKNSVRRVGLKRSLYCEEVCKDLSLLQSLMDTTNEVAFVLVFSKNNLPKMRVTMPLTATVAQLKKRVVSDYDNLEVSSLVLRVGGLEMKDAKTLSSCSIKENCIVNVESSLKAGASWTSF